MRSGQQMVTNATPAAAGLNGVQPVPPNGARTTKTANNAATAGIQKGAFTGINRAMTKPVTNRDGSEWMVAAEGHRHKGHRQRPPSIIDRWEHQQRTQGERHVPHQGRDAAFFS